MGQIYRVLSDPDGIAPELFKRYRGYEVRPGYWLLTSEESQKMVERYGLEGLEICPP